MSSERPCRDRGAVLVLTLILTMVMSVIVLAVASYATVGLRTSAVASERTETNADSSNVMSWAIEQFAKKQFRPEDPADCDDAPAYASIVPPPELATNGSTTTLQCARTNAMNGEPVVHLIARSTGSQTRVVEATLVVPQYTHGARISDWRVDIPIDVPAYTPPPAGGGNTAPSASATSWVVAPGSSTTQTLNASDADGTIVSAAISGAPATWTVTPFGTSVELTVDTPIEPLPQSYPLTYTVTDDDGATSSSTITVEITSVAPPPPNPACSFVVTSAAGDNKSGLGNLSVSNTGGDFSGWQVSISWPGGWAATWDSAVNASQSGSSMVVGGSQTIAQGSSLNFNAALTWSGGNPKISSGDARTCTVIAP